MSAVETQGVAAKPKLTEALVDCDVHPLYKELSDLSPYMSAEALASCRGPGHIGGSPREANRILHPTGPLRLDAEPPSGGPPGSDPDFARAELLDGYGIDAAVLVPIQAAGVIPWSDLELGNQYLAALNDYVLDNWVASDSRFKLAISVSPHDPEGAAVEVARHADTPGVVAINLVAAAIGLGKKHFDPLYRAACDHGLPIVHHPTGGEGNISTAPFFAGGLVRTYPEHHSMLAQAGQASLAGLVLEGALERFPELTFVFAEFGFTWVPSLTWRMDDAHAAAPYELRGLGRTPSEYVREQVRFTTQPIDEPAKLQDLWQTMEMMDAGKTLMFSSDYPHWDADDPASVLRTGVPPALREAVAHETARRCFGDRLGL